jgi:hypothetical protein
MCFTFTIKTRSGAVMKIEVEAADQKDADEKVKRENPTCSVVKVEKGNDRPMASAPLSGNVRTELRKHFPQRDEAGVVATLLLECGEPQYGVKRIRLDVLAASNGKVEHVRRLVSMAKLDPRDVIVEAEYDEIDGQLVAKGVALKKAQSNRPPKH